MSLVRNAIKPFKYGRFALNILGGSAFIESCYAAPKISGIHGKHLNDYPPFRFWVKDLLHSMNVTLETKGVMMEENGLFISNHVSWADTVVLNRARPLSFIARHDLEEWPAIGTFTRRMHSVYIDRSNKFQAYRCIPRIEERLQEGRSVVVFPESTTTNGTRLLPFYGMFYEAAVRQGSRVQPVALRYEDECGELYTGASFVGEDSFLQTLDRLLSIKKVYAKLSFLEPLDASKLNRKELCVRTKQMIAAELGLD
jgi:1-acyl-sn-glycerol-3-phosphate acyltransferase